MKGLIIDTPHIDNILTGSKTWEMRSTSTSVRGQIALIRKGSKTVIGIAEIVDSLGPFDLEQMKVHLDRHQISLARLQDPSVAKWKHAWVMHKAELLCRPVAYEHPPGAVIWVNLDERTTCEINSSPRNVRQENSLEFAGVR